MYIERSLMPILKNHLFQGKIIVIYGARQVGKTTLVKKMLEESGETYKYLNCDEFDIQDLLSNANTSSQLREILGSQRLIILDEAQRIRNIGLKLKLLNDNYPDLQIIATGSSSFDLSNDIAEPLTGRNFEFWLHPLSAVELKQTTSQLEFNRHLENFLVYGMYPAVIQADSLDKKIEVLKHLAANYLYKDVLKFQNLKNAEIVRKLLQALALQIGNEVSYLELSRLIGVSQQIIAQYIDILEKVFVLFRLPPFSRNLRKEISRSRKIYFYDLGIRNAIINNLNPLAIRNDTGNLWENFCIAEKMKQQLGLAYQSNFYFWRTYDQQEIDFIEEKGGKLYASEMKWSDKKTRIPKAFQNSYPDAQWEIVNRQNYLQFLR